jgi:hypothetical protein
VKHRPDLFHNVYVDESSQSHHRFLVVGGLIVPRCLDYSFQEGLAALRANTILPPIRPDGTPRVMKWEKVNDYNLLAYKSVVDAFFSFPKRERPRGIGESGVIVDIHCVAVDTSAKSLKSLGQGDVDIGFNKQIYFLCAAMIATRMRDALFHIYPDRRDAKYPLGNALTIMNRGIMKRDPARDYPVRRIRYEDPEHCQALQVVDIFIGALAYQLNGHYEKPDAKNAKKRLSDYILRRSKISNPFKTTPYHLRRFAIIHRPYDPKRQGAPTALHRL